MVCESDIMLPIEIDMPTWRCYQFNMEENKEGLRCATDLIDEIRDVLHIRKFTAKQRATIRYKSKVVSREMQKEDFVIR